MKKIFVVAALFFLLLWESAPGFAVEKNSVELFSPQGTVKSVRQVTARFTDPMIPFGDPRSHTDPFDISCPAKGSGRWADSHHWIYDFEADLPAGLSCEFAIRKGLKTLDGAILGGKQVFSFSTGGPAVITSRPYEGNLIDEEQIFILTLDAEPDPGSIEKHVVFSVDGIENPIGIKMIEGAAREKILQKVYPSRYLRTLPDKLNGNKVHAPLVLIQCKQRFPNDVNVSLVWGRGVRSKTGVATDQDQVLSYKTRQAFKADFSCERENRQAACIPLLPMTLNFSAPISKEIAKKIILRASPEKADKNPNARRKKGGQVAGPVKKIQTAQFDQNENDVYTVSFPGPFPERAGYLLELPGDIKDDAGRSLVNADRFPLAVRTGEYPPLAKFPARFGIIESQPRPLLPVTIRNIEAKIRLTTLQVAKAGEDVKLTGKILPVSVHQGQNIQHWLRKLAMASRVKSLLAGEKAAKAFSMPKPHAAKAFEVVGIPLAKPGFYMVELESRILGKSLLAENRPMYVQTAALVTNLSAHFKWGRESSLVWVTTLDKALPVKDAQVTIRNCQDAVIWRGKTDASGIARIPGSIPKTDTLPSCSFKYDEDRDYRYDESYMLSGLQSGLFVTVQTPHDMTFVHSSWDQGIEPWRFQLPEEYYQSPVLAHTILDRTLFRAGDKVFMKHILRRHSMRGFDFAAAGTLPGKLGIIHTGSGQKYEQPLVWDARAGVAESTWQIPQEAKLGRYDLVLDSVYSGSFQVEEFRIPLMKGVIHPPAVPQIRPSGVTLDLGVRYLAGGGAGSMPVKLRNEIRPKHLASFAGYEDFIFSNGSVKEGLSRRGAIDEDEEPPQEGSGSVRTSLPAMNLVLDPTGSKRTQVEHLSVADVPRELFSEMEYQDPAGEISTVSARTPLWHSEYLIGIKPDSWAASKDLLKFHVAVLDITGKPVEGADIQVDVFERKNYSHRKRLIGGFYAYEHTIETKKIATVCTGRTQTRGLLVCQTQSPVSGNIILQAQSQDASGRKTIANRDLWVADRDDWWFDVRDNDRIDLIAEKKRYEPGESARFQVRTPFRKATVLITVEREGILDAWIQDLSGKNPVIDVPVRPNYAPNVFVSALAVRGRAADIQPTSLVDLGKPAYKLGISEIQVGWKNYELKVNVTADKEVYPVRQKAKVKILAKTADGKIPPAGSEVALAAVDEGLLELMPNGSWDLLIAMMGRRGMAVKTSTAQTQVIGKRHFGLKAVSPGGGGGLAGNKPTRELFDALLLWKGRVLLDAKGEAELDIPLNDSLTSFRIAAVATAGAGFFGTGFTSIRSTQDLMIFSGLSPVIREGDKFFAGFTVRNTTDHPMSVKISASVSEMNSQIAPLSLALAAGEARESGWNITVPFGMKKMHWTLDAEDSGSSAKDRIRISQTVVPATPVRTFQSTLMQVDKTTQLDVERPQGAIPHQGGLRTSFKAKISDSLYGVMDYMKQYPYTCMEQKVSVAVALRDEAIWKETMAKLPAHLDPAGLVRFFPMNYLCGSPGLTSYILAIAHEAGWPIPAASKEKMQNGLKRFIEGKSECRSGFATADLSLRKLAAIEALAREGKAAAGMLDSISIEPNLWPTSAVIDWLNILRLVDGIPSRETRAREARQILRSRINFQGTMMGFSTEKQDRLWWLMVSPDVNAVRAVLALLPDAEWKQNLPRLAQGALARQKRGHWDLTCANAWGVLAMEKFSETFESALVSGSTRMTLAKQNKTIDWSMAPKGKTEFLNWPDKKDTLRITHSGAGKPWLTVSSLAAIPLKEPFSTGYKIKKTVTPLEQKNKGRLTRGDILRVSLEIDAQMDQTWVVVNDPIPAGAAILGGSLARSSQMLVQDEKRKGWVWPAFEERSFEAFRAYYEYVPKGRWSVEYTLRLNAGGTFHLPPTRVEAMYFPEMLGEIPNTVVTVEK